MGSPLSENSPPMPFDPQMVIQELINGKKLTSELQILLGKPSEHLTPPSAKALAGKIFLSITDALSILNSGETHEGCWNSATTHHRSPRSGDQKIKDSSEKLKIPAGKDQRGVQKRRRASAAFQTLSASPFDDGYVWRKYGQKEILGAKHPRGYFRCTHKHDQGCQATKHVQKSEKDPSMYVVTYMGHHTCNKDVLKTPKLILDSTSGELSLLNYEATMAIRKHDHLPTSSFASVKHESIAEKPIDLNQDSSSLSGYLVSFDIHDQPFHSHLPMEFPVTVPDAGDVASSSVYSSTSSHNFDVDFMDAVEFEDVLCFNEPGFL